MSIYHDHHRQPSLTGARDAHTGSQTSTPRASWQSRGTTQTWLAPQQYSYKAPPLEPVLNTVPATNTSSNIELPHSPEEEHMTIDADGPERESVLGARQADSPGSSKPKGGRNFVGGFVNSLKMLPKTVMKGYGADQNPPLAADKDEPEASNVTRLQIYEGDEDMTTPEITVEYVDARELPPEPLRPFEDPLSVSTRYHDAHTYDGRMYGMHSHETPHYDTRNYNNQIYDNHAYHPRNIHTEIHYPQDGETSAMHHEVMHEAGPSMVYQPRHHTAETPAVHYDSAAVNTGFHANRTGVSLQEDVPFQFLSPSDSAQTDSSLKTPSESTPRSRFGIRRFFKSLYHLPWISSRITSVYKPRGRGGGHQPTETKPAASWYFRRRYSLDLLSSGDSLPTMPVDSNERRHRDARVQASSTDSPSSRRAASGSPNHRRRHHHQRNTSDVTPRPPTPPNSHRRHASGHRPPVSPPARGHQRVHTGHASVSPASGSPKSPTSSRERRHRRRKSSDISLHSPTSPSHGFPAYPLGYAPYPFVPPPQPLFVVTPHSPSSSAGGKAEMRQAVPVYMLAPTPPTLVPQPEVPNTIPQPGQSPKPTRHPTPISPSWSHRSQAV
jgi:hypothetical protein